MAKERKSRRAEGGAAKQPAKRPAAPASHAHSGGLFDLDSEQSARLLLFGAVALIVAIAAGFLVFGYYYTVIKPRNRTVLQVADQKVSYADMKRRMSYEYVQNSRYQTQQGVSLLAEATFQTLLNELTEITQAGPRLGVSIEPSELDTKLRAKLAIGATSDQRQFADALRAALQKAGLSEAEYRRISEAEAYDSKILEKFKADAPGTATQAKISLIATATEDAANQALARVNSGEEFSAVAREVSTESDAKTTGGVKDYDTKESMNAAYAEFAFSAEVGGVSSVLRSSSAGSTGTQATVAQYFVVKVLDRSDQPLTDAQKGVVAQARLPEWLKATQDEMVANGTIKRDWDQQAQSDALVAISGDAASKLAEQKKQQQDDQKKQQDARSTTIAQLTASPQVAGTPSPDSTVVTQPTDAQGQSSSPVAPAQPVAPGSNGQ